MDLLGREDIPPIHRQFLEHAVAVLRQDARIVGVAVAGSLAGGGADEFSDVDLVIAVEPEWFDPVLAERTAIAASLGNLAAAATGEHVGEPRLLICLYHDPVLHVDLKFVPLPEAVPVVDNPVAILDRDNRLEAVLRQRDGSYPPPDIQWIEDRFWIWVHYLAGKIARGELFEALDGLSFLRRVVFVPLGLFRLGMTESGVRRLEEQAPEVAHALTATVAQHNKVSLWNALDAAISLYRNYRADFSSTILRREAETVALRTVGELRKMR